MTEEQKRKRDESAEAKATELWFHPNQPTEIDWAVRSALLRAFKAGADWGFDQGFAEGRAEIERLERELAEAKRMLDYERSAVDRLMECEANEAAQKGQYRAKVERLTAERDEWRQEALKHIDWLHAEQDETERLKTELAKRQGETGPDWTNPRYGLGEPAKREHCDAELGDFHRANCREYCGIVSEKTAKREGELHMNSDCNVEKLHMNSKGEPAKCELHKNDDVTQNSDINIVSRANPAAIPNGDNGGAKMPPLRRMQFNGHEYVHLQEVLESVDAIKAERDRLLDREKGEG